MKIIKVLASLFIFASLMLPSLAYADHNEAIEQNGESEIGPEVNNPVEEEFQDDTLVETEDDLTEIEDSPVVEVEDNESVELDETDEVGDSSPEEIVDDEQPKNELDESVEQDEPVEEDKVTEEAELEVPQMRMAKSSIVESKTSLLGHLRASTVRIYKDLENSSDYVQAGTTYTNAVYYIKKQANYNGGLYYLISNNASSTSGVIGWVKSTDVSTHKHTGIDHIAKTYYVKGTGSAYARAWGGSKDIVFGNLSSLKGEQFKINLTEQVGNNVWYRGVLNGKVAWIHESYLTQSDESSTSRLGHIKNSSIRIYGSYKDSSKYALAGSSYINEVYYIKKEANYNKERYYLISRNPSSTQGVIGWVKSSDLSTHTHVGVDRTAKTYYVKGTGSAYSKAWGGSKNIVYKNLSSFQGQEFKVNLTERVGNNTWYRGTLNGKTAWVHSNFILGTKESSTSRLGHIKNSSVHIYKDYKKKSQYTQAGTANTNEVYYIKKQAEYDKVLYYLISRSPSSVNGVVGWVKSGDISTHAHVGVDKNAKTYYIKGPGSAYTKAWGGSKNTYISSLNSIKGQEFKVNLTEKVGNNLWYRGIINGKNAWIHSSYITTIPLKIVDKTYTNYNLTFSKMTDIQSVVAPQTDKRYPLWIREDGFEKGSISNNQGTIAKGANWNLRREPTTKSSTGGQVTGGTKLTIYASAKGTDDPNYTWYHVRNTSGWVQPDRTDLSYYLNPSNFTSFKDTLQFLKLSHSANIDVAEVNTKVLQGKGILAGRAQAFVDAGKTHGVNEIYLISHALLETGNGSSVLAKGVSYKGKTVYNMYGIGAKDSCPLECGTEYAYNAGWFTPEQAIIGGASFIGKGYVQAGQDTLYKMRWNPSFAERNGYASHQYATDIGWALKQTSRMNELYGLLDSYKITLDIPRYK